MARKKVTFTCPDCGKDVPKAGLCAACAAALLDTDQKPTETPQVKSALQVGKSQVKVKQNAVWWGTDITPPAWIFNQTFYLQYWHIATGKAIIGNSPRADEGDSVGTLSIEYLEQV